MKPKTLGNDPEGIVKNLGYVSQIFLPKTMGNDTVPYSFVYVIAPYVIDVQYFWTPMLANPKIPHPWLNIVIMVLFFGFLINNFQKITIWKWVSDAENTC